MAQHAVARSALWIWLAVSASRCAAHQLQSNCRQAWITYAGTQPCVQSCVTFTMLLFASPQDSKSEGVMLKETTNINSSLFNLGKVHRKF